jgi:quinol monooxygenase YgiN
VVLEIYENDDALAAHRKSEHFRTLSAGLGPTLAGAPDIHYLDSV